MKEVFWLTAAYEKAVLAVIDNPKELIRDKDGLFEKYAQLLSVYVSNLYGEEFLRNGDLKKIPSLHRFGIRLWAAYEKLQNGDKLGYLRDLRGALTECNEMKDVVICLLRKVA